MKNKIKLSLLCFAAAALVTVSGTSFADTEENIPAVEESASDSEKKAAAEYRCCAENKLFRLLVDDVYGNLALENKQTGYIWYSAPIDLDKDETALPLIADELRSSAVLRYGIPEKRSNTNFIRSAADECSLTVTDIENGVRINYKFSGAGFEFPAEYILEGDHLTARVKAAEIKETNPSNIATELTLMNAFGAASDKEEGYFVIPDGSGALIRFNNHKNSDTNVYSQTVYGNDITAVPTSRSAVTEQIYLPVYGIVKEGNGLLAVASGGDSNAYLTAKVSGQSNSCYNICGFTFVLRGSDIFYMSGNNSDKLTVFESGNIKSDDIELKYYPISADEVDFIDIAQRYRRYLTEEESVTKKTEKGKASMYVSLYGGTEKKKPVLGVPVTMKTAATTFDEATQILTELKNNGADDIVVSYKNWTDSGIKDQVDEKASPSGILGGKSGFNNFTKFMEENGFELFPVSDSRCFVSGGGYNSFSDTCIRISGAYSRVVSYDLAYGIPDGFKENKSLLSPGYFGKVFGNITENYSSAGLEGVSLGSLTSSLYGDYGKKNISRAKAMELAVEGYETISEKLENGILAETANAYALPYVSHVTKVPLSSSRFDLFNEDVPFYQAVLHGMIPYSSEAVNASPDPKKQLILAAATGSLPDYDFIGAESGELKDTDLDVYFYANYAGQTASAAEVYKQLKPLYTVISEAEMTAFSTENNGLLITVGYSDGTTVKADLDALTIEFNGNVINFNDNTKGEKAE